MKTKHLLLALTVPALSAHAQNWTGAGANGNWSTAANWTDFTTGSPVVPANNGTAILEFAGGQAQLTPNMDAAWNVNGVRFDDNAASSSYVLGSTAGKTLTVQGYLQDNSASLQTINTAVRLGSGNVSVEGSYYADPALTLNGALDTNGNTFNATGNVAFNGAVIGSGGISVPPNVLVAGGTTLAFTAANSYLGATALRDSTTTVSGNSGALANTSGVLLDNATLHLGNAASTVANPDRLNDNAVVTLHNGVLTLAGTNNAATTSERVAGLSLTGGTSFLSVQPGTSGKAELVSTAALARAAGAVGVVSGTNLGQGGAANTARILFGAAPTLVGGGGTTATNASIVPYLVADTSAAQNVHPSFGGGTYSLLTYGANGLRPLDPTTEFAAGFAAAAATDNVSVTRAESVGNLTVNSVAFFNANGAPNLIITAGSTLHVTSGAVLFAGAGGGTISGGTLDFGTAEGVLGVPYSPYGNGNAISSTLTGTGGVTIAGGGLVLSGDNAYTGVTSVAAGVTLTSNNALGATGAGNDTVIQNGGSLTLTNNVTVGDNLSTQASGIGSSVPIYSAAGSNAVSGNISIGGTSSDGVRLDASNNSSLTVSGNITANQTLPSGGTTYASLIAEAGSTVTVTGQLKDGTSPLSLSVYGGGTTILTGSNAFSGSTQFSAGTLLLDNATGAGLTGSSVFVQDTATLGGTGSIGLAAGGNVFLRTGGTISPGDPSTRLGVGTLTIGTPAAINNLSAAGASKFILQVGSASDMVRIYGGLQLQGSGILLDISSAGGAGPGTYVLIAYTTTLTGAFNDLVLNSLPAGWQGSLVNDAANHSVDLVLTQVPEPSARVLAAAGLVCAAAWQRARRRARA